MKITRITVYQVDLPLQNPYWLSGGRLKFDVLNATIVTIDTNEWLLGWGAGTPWGHTYVLAHGPGIYMQNPRQIWRAGISQDIPHQVCGGETLFDIFFTDRACVDYRTTKHDDIVAHQIYNSTLRAHAVFKSAGKLYPSLAETAEDLHVMHEAVAKAVAAIATSRQLLLPHFGHILNSCK